MDVKVLEVYMGTNIPEIIPICHYLYEPTDFPYDEMMNKELIIFARDLREDKYVKCFYFEDVQKKPVVLPCTAFNIEKIKTELKQHDQLIAEFQKNAPEFPYENEVKALINDFFDANKARQSYQKLEDLGPDAAPAIIKYMNDKRDLAVQGISLKNKFSGAWEAFRHYGARKVIEVLAAILNQLVGYSFTFIYNGGTDAQHTKEYFGWIVWLNKRKK